MIALKIAIIDDFKFEGWYTWKLVNSLRKYLSSKDMLYLYAPKIKANIITTQASGKMVFKYIWSKYSLLCVLRHLIHDKIDVLHVQFEFDTFGLIQSFLNLPLVLFLAKFILGKKVIVTLHGPIFPKNKHKEICYLINSTSKIKAYLFILFTILVYKLIDISSDIIIVHAKVFKEWLRSWHILKTLVIPHGVEIDYSGKSKDKQRKKFTILYFGVFSPRKGIEYLIDAYTLFKREVHNSILILAGGPSKFYPKYYLKIVHRVSEDKSPDILITGPIKEAYVQKLFRIADVIVLPYVVAYSASGPLSLAIGYGRPIIISSLEYFNEILSCKEVIFVPPKDSDALFNALKRVYKDDTLRESLIKFIRKKAEIYSWDVVAKRTLCLYRRIVRE